MTGRPAQAKPAPPAEKVGTTYTSTSPVYTGGQYFKPGEKFVSDAPKGADWAEVSSN